MVDLTAQQCRRIYIDCYPKMVLYIRMKQKRSAILSVVQQIEFNIRIYYFLKNVSFGFLWHVLTWNHVICCKGPSNSHCKTDIHRAHVSLMAGWIQLLNVLGKGWNCFFSSLCDLLQNKILLRPPILAHHSQVIYLLPCYYHVLFGTATLVDFSFSRHFLQKSFPHFSCCWEFLAGSRQMRHLRASTSSRSVYSTWAL